RGQRRRQAGRAQPAFGSFSQDLQVVFDEEQQKGQAQQQAVRLQRIEKNRGIRFQKGVTAHCLAIGMVYALVVRATEPAVAAAVSCVAGSPRREPFWDGLHRGKYIPGLSGWLHWDKRGRSRLFCQVLRQYTARFSSLRQIGRA